MITVIPRHTFGIMCFLLLIIIGLLVYYPYQRKKENENSEEKRKEMEKWVIANQRMYYTFFSKNHFDTLILSKQLSNTSSNFRYDTGRVYLVFRFQETNCEACVEQQVKLLDSLSHSTLARRVILMGAFSMPEGIAIFKQNIKTTLPVINIHKDLLNYPVDQLNIPYFFAVKNNQASMFFFPSISFISLTVEYIESIKQTL